MFSLEAISSGGYNHFATGNMYNGKVNGMQTMIMQSQEYTDKLIEQFEMAIAAGYNPNMVENEVFDKVGCSLADLTDFDQQRLKTKVEQLYRSNKNYK